MLNDDENMWMVTFYANWCPYCKPVYEELNAAKNDYTLMDKKVKFGVIDVMANRDLLKEYDVKQSPSIKVFGADKENPEDYYGLRKASNIVSFINNYAEKQGFVDKSLK